MNTKEMEYIGSFSVDSGQAIIGDPCYLDEWENWSKDEPFDNYVEKKGQYGYLGACGLTLTKGYGTLGTGNAVAFTTGYGDGVYPVYAEFNDEGRVSKIVVEFIQDEEF